LITAGCAFNAVTVRTAPSVSVARPPAAAYCPVVGKEREDRYDYMDDKKWFNSLIDGDGKHGVNGLHGSNEANFTLFVITKALPTTTLTLTLIVIVPEDSFCAAVTALIINAPAPAMIGNEAINTTVNFQLR